MSSGKSSEAEFEEICSRFGKAVNVFRFTDTFDVRRLTKTAMKSAQPADFLVTARGVTFFAEIKETSKDRFSLAMFTPKQIATATQVAAAGGLYYAFVRELATNKWFKIPLIDLLDQETKTFHFCNLEKYRWNSLM